MTHERAVVVAALASVWLAAAIGCGGDDDGSSMDGGATGMDASLRDGGHVDEVREGEGGGGGDDAAAPADGSTGTDGGGGGEDGGGGAGGVPLCSLACATAADCDQGSAGFREANYDCTAGACVYRGCLATDCTAGFSCAMPTGYPFPVCLKDCTTPSDCPLSAGLPNYDADNFRCDAGSCVYLGCNSDAECDMAESGYVCRAWPSLGPTAIVLTGRVCTAPCATRDTCGSTLTPGGAFDADNYTCTGGACIYAGCNTDAECTLTTGPRPSVCR